MAERFCLPREPDVGGSTFEMVFKSAARRIDMHNKIPSKLSARTTLFSSPRQEGEEKIAFPPARGNKFNFQILYCEARSANLFLPFSPPVEVGELKWKSHYNEKIERILRPLSATRNVNVVLTISVHVDGEGRGSGRG